MHTGPRSSEVVFDVPQDANVMSFGVVLGEQLLKYRTLTDPQKGEQTAQAIAC